MAQTYNMKDILDTTLIAKGNIEVYDKLPYLGGIIKFIAPKGSTIGTIYTWFEHNGEIWYEVATSQTASGYVYVKQDSSKMEAPVGVLSIEEQAALDAKNNMTLADQIKSVLMPLAFIGFGAYVLINLMKPVITKKLASDVK